MRRRFRCSSIRCTSSACRSATRSVVVKGRIAHCYVGELRNDVTVYRTGLEFVEPSEPVRQAIAAFVDTLTAARRIPVIIDAEVADDGL